MDKLLHYQVEQENIFQQIKIQINQDLNLADIIQNALERSCKFLQLDRLLIYQLNVPSEVDLISELVRTTNIITYEAKQDNVESILYFQEEVCWHQFMPDGVDCDRRFSLAIENVEEEYQANSYLQSLIQKFQVKAKIVTPIIVSGNCWGLIIAHQCFYPRSWQDSEITFLKKIAEYLAIAIYHHQSYQQLQQQKIILEQQVQTQAQQIKDALIAAEAAHKSKHEFLGSMSHELRTPLTCVIGLSSTLLQWSSSNSAISLSPEKQQQYLHLIQQSGKHLLALIDNILEFSDVESGKHLLNIQQISLNTIVRQSLHLLQASAKAKQISLNSEIKLNLDQEYFFADEIRLKEILYNLLGNGIKFTPQGGKVILRVWREKRQVVFQVEDTGIGIGEGEIPLLFEKFKQIEHFRHRTHGGAGLGLALTRKLVELHGGSIEVESALGQGSTFTVYLPHKNSFTLHNDDNTTSIKQNQKTSPTIMLVTDDEENATFICQLLNTIDCQVVWLMDSMMAMNQLDLVQPRLIIVDRNFALAGVDNLAQTISSKFSERIDLILLCDRNPETVDLKLDRELFSEYLIKDMNPTQIINKIKSMLDSE